MRQESCILVARIRKTENVRQEIYFLFCQEEL